MYNKGFFIESPVGNNEFSFDKRQNKKLFVPEIIEAKSFDEIKFQDDLEKIAFEDFDFDDKLSTNYGLKNFYRFQMGGKEVVLFDNHNHAFYFWYEARSRKIIGDKNILIHIDQHADTRDNGKIISKSDSKSLEKVFDFTNFVLNVGDYIIPAQKEGIIENIVQIRNTKNLEDYLQNFSNKKNNSKIILNLDLDFFASELDFIDFELKKKVILDAFEKASYVTVCTSPFFVDQGLAVEKFKEIFKEKLL
ncbi:hypothetical protein BLD25_04420 [Candidatus Gracilibacteria bacterium GN02-872]|nr:hypothetical protein BLD25_04420 [Candidatus Gracilibacteria bacterium GN02-872]